MEASMYDIMSEGPDSAVKRLKRNMTLDFNGAGSKAKKTSTLLQSPDLHMLKLASPELEKMIIQANGLVTTTPTPTSFIFPKFVTEEQEAYARGFVDALAQLQSGQPESGGLPVTSSQVVEAAKAVISNATNALGPSFPPNSVVTQSSSLPVATSLHQLNATTTLPNGVVLSTASATLPVSSAGGVVAHSKASLPSHLQHSAPVVDIRLPKLEEEPQTVPCLSSSPPLSPINMESQERIKLERKRARNRVAARKCRTRKLERISRLEDRVKDLKGQNGDLLTTATSLREQVMKLKQQIVEHVSSGCQIMVTQNLSL
ncbi:transcription factor Jun-like [Littorina saxatilis]|uniref:BZIP domain-containing protein n=1 Tax=Littorina saxatilis TaxID=31220 RepID=A0AAN9GAC5_9CAEN|eukprot:GHVL01023760.1.p1 GENE.GHVL01023760.1~~GHVL01023760.1.p1  ORF type:complete len:316 (+),score=21.33 GHVL01023760.1:184-1131(+)